jgi:hypothetical protein
VEDVEPYRLLFWNNALTADEVRLFGDKLASEFPALAYDVYLWLASIFEVSREGAESLDLAVLYYQKAAGARPAEPDPYLDACDCYDPDLNFPPLPQLIEFLKRGIPNMVNPVSLYKRLAQLYELSGDPDEAERCRRLADEGSTGGTETIQGE